MARAPVEGEVKTRLVGPFTPPEVLELYLNFLRDTFAMMEAPAMEKLSPSPPTTQRTGQGKGGG